MKKRIASFITLIFIMQFFSFSVIYAKSEKMYVIKRVPYIVDYTKNDVVKARYSDTKEPISLSLTYNDYLYAFVPSDYEQRDIESYITETVEFSDYNITDYRFRTMEELSRTGIITGNEKKEALPESYVTRAEAIAMIMRLLGLKTSDTYSVPFLDVKKDDWFFEVVASAYNYGIIKGYSETVFMPQNNITREEIAVMVNRAAELASLAYPSDKNSNAIDKGKVSDWAVSAYEKYGTYIAYDIDNTDNENPKRLYNPQNKASRYEVGNLIYRISTDCLIFPSQKAIEFGFDKGMPIIDGSTSTYPFTEAVYQKLFSNGYFHHQMPKKHSKSHESYKKLIDGEIDMMFASVYPASDILEYAAKNNVELELIPIAYDAMIFFTNIKNPATNLTKEQISNIYVNNAYSNWNEIGGPDALLYPYCRNNDSGSHAQMEKHFLNGNEIHKTIREETTSETMSNVLTDVMNAETDNPKGYGLGYSIYYYFNNMDLFYNTKSKLKLLSIDGVNPDDETIASGEYPLSNNTYVVLRKDTPPDAPERKMAEFMLTKEGQQCVVSAGFGKLIKE